MVRKKYKRKHGDIIGRCFEIQESLRNRNLRQKI